MRLIDAADVAFSRIGPSTRWMFSREPIPVARTARPSSGPRALMPSRSRSPSALMRSYSSGVYSSIAATPPAMVAGLPLKVP